MAARRLRHLRLTSVPKHYAEKHRLQISDLPSYTGFELVLLGTGAGMPSIHRGASSVCVQLPRKSWLVDCGEGSLRQLFRSTVRVTTTEKIFLTHVHGDHLFGLPGLLCTLNALNVGYVAPNAKEISRRPIDIYAPRGVFDFVNTALIVSAANMSNVIVTVHELVHPTDIMSRPTIPRQVHECLRHTFIQPQKIDDNLHWKLVDDGEHTVMAGMLNHSVPCFGYVMEENEIKGRLDADAAQRRGLPPGPLYRLLKEGTSVELPDGTLLHPHEVTGPSRRGRKVAILGDSCDSSAMFPLARNVDVLVHEATLDQSKEATAIERGHSTSSMAGRFARSMNATLLVLTHFSHRFSPAPTSTRSVQQLVEEARKTFGKRAVVDAFDLMRIRIPPHH
ncbi:hypothetical protein LEN26_000249 [Aphanomyces euteiches]|nr:hypothetical protein AeMF1_001395 [Aphanomyces euteiches]KAH9163957.1 hypothetical protein LEN26_000249 [Aphanomyces euteiches]KAH9195121.1 hypothetical protein AeNC1_002904 [Aphanomyces euteiches]